MIYLFVFAIIFFAFFCIKIFFFSNEGKKSRKKGGVGGRNYEDGEEYEEEEEEEGEVDINEDWRLYEDERGGLKFRYPTHFKVTRTVSEPVVMFQILRPNERDLTKVQSVVITIESVRVPVTGEEYMKKSLGVISKNKISIKSEKKRKINGIEYFEMEYSFKNDFDSSQVFMYGLCTYFENRIFTCQEVCRSQENIDSGVLRKLIKTLTIEPTKAIGILTYVGYGFSLRIPTPDGIDTIENSFPTNLIYFGKKALDGKNELVVRLDEEMDTTISNLRDICRAEAREQSEENYEETEVSLFSENEEIVRPIIMISHPSKDKKGKIFVIPFETKDKRCFRLKYFAREKYFEDVMRSIDSIEYRLDKQLESSYFHYHSLLLGFEITFPDGYSCLEFSHDHPFVSFEKIGGNDVLANDIHLTDMESAPNILTLEDVKKDTHLTFNKSDLIKLVSERFLRINGKKYYQFSYSQKHQFSEDVVYVFQSTTILNGMFFFIRTISVGVKFEGRILEEALKIHMSVKFL